MTPNRADRCRTLTQLRLILWKPTDWEREGGRSSIRGRVNDKSSRVLLSFSVFQERGRCLSHFEQQPFELVPVVVAEGSAASSLAQRSAAFPRRVRGVARDRYGGVHPRRPRVRRRAVQDGAEGIGTLGCGAGCGGHGRMEAGAAEGAFCGC